MDRGTVRVKCLAEEHNIMSLAKAQHARKIREKYIKLWMHMGSLESTREA